MKDSESEEMYLETILRLKSKISVVRSIDVAEELGYSKPSVSRAVGLLKNRGYISVNKSGELVFTDEGRKKAEHVFERHRVITEALVKIGADRTSAEENACRIEHVITEDVFLAIKKYAGENRKG